MKNFWVASACTGHKDHKPVLLVLLQFSAAGAGRCRVTIVHDYPCRPQRLNRGGMKRRT